MQRHWVYLTLMALILSACQIRSTESQTVSQLPSQTPYIFTQIAPGLDTPFIPTRSPTTTPLPPEPTLSPQQIAGSILKELNIDKELQSSPNGMCTWERLTGFTNTEPASDKYDNQIFEYVTVTCGPEPGKIVLVDEWSGGGLGYSIPALLGWSIDEKYLYFNNAVIPDGCQPLGGYQENVRKVDLTNGAILSIPIKLEQGMTLSPLTDKVVFSDPQTNEVGIYQLNDGMAQLIPIKLPDGIDYWEAGNFTWSEDEQNIVFVVQYGAPCAPTLYSVRRIDIANNQIVTLLESKNQIIRILEWKNPNQILISKDKINNWLDPTTGAVTLVPECPDNCVVTPPE
jgi:hypothetical protein